MKTSNQANLSIQVIPINTTEAYPMIEAAIKVIQASGLRYEVQPFATIVEGELEALMELALKAKQAALDAGADELILNMQIHLKKDADVSFEEKRGKYSK